MPDVLSMFDALLEENGPAAICIKQPLQSIEGPDAALIFPPTYAAPKDDSTKKPRYNIDELSPDNLTCSVDSVGSQANRVEPLFKRKKYSHLVPLVTVAHNGETTNLLDVGHRLADAIIRFSDLLADVHHAFEAYNDGNALPMAKLGPTSLVFGAWDSRGTQHKVSRIINMRIEADHVKRRTRSAQYTPATDYVANELIEEVDENTGSDLGFVAVPATGTLGGVQVFGEISRICSMNLAILRDLQGPTPKETQKLQRYILGLCLVALTAEDDVVFNLRQGCQLIYHQTKQATTNILFVRTTDQNKGFKLNLDRAKVLEFASAASADFEVGESRKATFDSPLANRIRKLWAIEKTRSKLKDIAKTKPLTKETLDEFERVQAAKTKKTKD